ncbi:MAG: hypothetical protein Q7T96_11415 [Methylobacter sp.]|nr:hypothetical protein [Methylobacter sp.]
MKTSILHAFHVLHGLKIKLRWFPNSGLGTQLAKLQLRESGSWSFQDCIPKPELGNERRHEKKQSKESCCKIFRAFRVASATAPALLNHRDVANAENAGAVFCLPPASMQS